MTKKRMSLAKSESTLEYARGQRDRKLESLYCLHRMSRGLSRASGVESFHYACETGNIMLPMGAPRGAV